MNIPVGAQGTPLLLRVVSAAISAEVISRFGTDGQRATWLPGLAAGTTKIVFAITEPDAGSNTHRLSTTATRDGEGWVLRGTKYYISGVDEAAALLVVAPTGAAPSATAECRKRGRNEAPLSLFTVPADSPGLQRQVLPVDLLLPEKQFTLHFDDVRVGPEALVGQEGNGFRQVFQGLNPERITGAAQCVGSRATCWARRPGTPVSARCGTRRSAPTRAWPIRWPERRSTPSWPH